jgi:uncharacterized membrane protein
MTIFESWFYTVLAVVVGLTVISVCIIALIHYLKNAMQEIRETEERRKN